MIALKLSCVEAFLWDTNWLPSMSSHVLLPTRSMTVGLSIPCLATIVAAELGVSWGGFVGFCPAVGVGLDRGHFRTSCPSGGGRLCDFAGRSHSLLSNYLKIVLVREGESKGGGVKIG